MRETSEQPSPEPAPEPPAPEPTPAPEGGEGTTGGGTADRSDDARVQERSY